MELVAPAIKDELLQRLQPVILYVLLCGQQSGAFHRPRLSMKELALDRELHGDPFKSEEKQRSMRRDPVVSR